MVAGRPGRLAGRLSPGRAATGLTLALPGALTAFCAFQAGGYFAGTHGLLAVVLALILVLRVTLADDPFAGASLALGLVAGALSLLAGWMLVSSGWSGAGARALLEFDRSLVYVLAVLLFGTLAMTPGRLAWMLRGVAAAVVAVCLVALITRTLPAVWPIGDNIEPARLSYPVTYWNALGLLAALGTIACVHLTCGSREPRWLRPLAAAAVPITVCALYFTLSRGAIAAGAIGLVAYLLLARPGAALGGLLATVPAAAVAVRSAYGAPALVFDNPVGPAAVAQGRGVAITIAACALGAALVRLAAAWWLDPRLSGRAAALGRRSRLALLGAAAIALLAAVVVTGLPGRVATQYQQFVDRRVVRESADARTRLTDPSNNGRLDGWGVAVDNFRSRPWVGSGAGTFEILWNRDRPFEFQTIDGHSLYLETLAELGVVGGALVVVALLTLMVGGLRRARGPDRALLAAVSALLVTWIVHAGVDWDWEMPVVTLPVLALGAAALAVAIPRRPAAGAGPASQPGGGGLVPGRTLRVAIALGCLVLVVVPARVWLSQRELTRAVRTFERRDCPRTVDHALNSIAILSARPEAYQLLGYCDIGLARPELAVRALGAALDRDPDGWQYHYGLALVQASAGIDPLPAAREAARLNPREGLAQEAVELFTTRDSAQWRERAKRARLP